MARAALLADGVGAVFASWALTGVRVGRVTGIDLMEKLVFLAAEKGYGVYLFGARQDVLDKLQAVLRETYPTLRIVGSRNGYFSDAEEPAIVDAIRESGADLVFVAMGTPAKELWIDRNFDKLGSRSFSGMVARATTRILAYTLSFFLAKILTPDVVAYQPS